MSLQQRLTIAYFACNRTDTSILAAASIASGDEPTGGLLWRYSCGGDLQALHTLIDRLEARILKKRRMPPNIARKLAARALFEWEHTVCTKCRGDKCTHCGNTGRTRYTSYDRSVGVGMQYVTYNVGNFDPSVDQLRQYLEERDHNFGRLLRKAIAQ